MTFIRQGRIFFRSTFVLYSSTMIRHIILTSDIGHDTNVVDEYSFRAVPMVSKPYCRAPLQTRGDVVLFDLSLSIGTSIYVWRLQKNREKTKWTVCEHYYNRNNRLYRVCSSGFRTPRWRGVLSWPSEDITRKILFPRFIRSMYVWYISIFLNKNNKKIINIHK